MKSMFSRTVVGVLSAVLLTILAQAGSAAPAEKKDLTATLQERIAKMTPEQQAALLKFVDQMDAGKEGKASPTAVTPEAAMREALHIFEQDKANNKFNIDNFLSGVSKDFSHPLLSVKGPEGMRKLFDLGVTLGLVANGVPDVTISLERTKWTVDGDKATAYPVSVDSPIGSAALTIHGKLEDGVWRMTSVDGI